MTITAATKEFIIDLELTKQLIEEQTVEYARFNPELNQGILKLNGIHNETPVIIFPITFDKYDDIKNEDIEFLIKELTNIDVESFDITNIINVLYLEGNKQKIIHSIREYNIWKLLQDQQQQQEEDNSLECESVSSTIRKHDGRVRTKGRITSISKIDVMISKLGLYCNDCSKTTGIEFDFPVHDIKYVKKRCEYCNAFINKEDFDPEFINAVRVELGDIKTYNEMDRLEVYLFDEHTENILVNETVEIIGQVHVIDEGKKRHSCVYADSIEYVNRNNTTLSEDDKKEVEEFATKHGINNTIDELVKIYDYSIVRNDHVKKGSLFIAVNTSDKIEDSEHLDALLIGPPGLGKTELLERVTEVVPGSSMESGEKASGKTITAIVDKTNDSTSLRLGAIPGARDGICGLDEIGKMSFEDQAQLLSPMQKRFFTINKHGISATITCPTSIVASANPTHDANWKYDDKIEIDEFPLLRQLIDRFDLVFIFRKPKSRLDNDSFIDELSKVKDKRDKGELPDETEFIIKYVQYAKRFNPILSDGATLMIREFYKQVNLKDFGSPRILDTLRKITKAVARLKLKDVADEDDAKEAMQFYNVMLLNFQKQVVVSRKPQDVAYEKSIERLQQIKAFGGTTMEELIKHICENNEQLASYFGYGEKSLKMRDNKKIHDLCDRLLNHSKIKTVQEKPLVLQWLVCDPCDPCDLDQKEKIKNDDDVDDDLTAAVDHVTGIQFKKDGPIHFSKSDLDQGSHRTHRSHSEEIKEQEGKV